MIGKKVILLAAPILAMSLWGCSSSFDAEKNQTPETGNVVIDSASIGAGNCIGCHRDSDLTTAESPQVIIDYLAGKHVIHSTHIDAASGDCLECHDPFGDGRSLENLIEPGGDYESDPAAEIPLAGLAAVTCETCHGAGGDHANGVPIPYKTPDYNRCGQCHDADANHHHNYHPEADSIVENYTTSKHFAGAVQNLAICVKCHTDEGAIQYKNVDTAAALAATTPIPVANNIQCRTCHAPHNNNLLLEEATDDTAPHEGSAEYNTCTNCHQRHDAAIGAEITQIPGSSNPDGSSGDLIFHAGSWDRVISSTHLDKPETPDVIEGYVIDSTSERACRNCHNVHEANAAINKQWAKSGHGGFIRLAKEAKAAAPAATPIAQVAAVRAAGVTEDGYDEVPGVSAAVPGAGAWVHYPWTTDERPTCARCHTATGTAFFLEYLKKGYAAADFDPTAIPVPAKDYDPNAAFGPTDIPAPADADPVITRSLYDVDGKFPHITMARTWDPTANRGRGGWAYSELQRELLTCSSCHANNSGDLRSPGAFTAAYADGDPAAAAVYPDAAGSNVCIPCHAGQQSGESIAILTTDFTNGTVVTPHYLAAAGILYAKSGYHYGGRDYSNTAVDADVGSHEHTTLGMGTTGVAAIDDEYTNGPCVTCHFDSKDGSHTLSPLTQYSATNLALNPVCVNCHGKRGETYEGNETNAGNVWLGRPDSNGDYPPKTQLSRYQASIEVLAIQLDAAGHPALPGYPYFTPGDWTAISTAAEPVSGEDTMGAAFNFSLLQHDHGGIAHNRQYTRRLLYDSIDFLDDGNLNYSVLTTLNAMDTTGDFTVADQIDAISLLINKDLEIGTAAERF